MNTIRWGTRDSKRYICILCFIRKVNKKNHPIRYELVSSFQNRWGIFLRIYHEQYRRCLSSSGGRYIADDLRDFWCDRFSLKGRRDKKCTRSLARVRLKNVRFYRDGPWEKFDGNDTSVRPSSRAFSLSHSLSVSSLFLSLSLSSLVRAYTVL